MVFRVRDGITIASNTFVDIGLNVTSNAMSVATNVSIGQALTVNSDVLSQNTISFANTDGTRKVHMKYNYTTNSLDTVFE